LELLKANLDLGVIAVLGFMSLLAVTVLIERIILATCRTWLDPRGRRSEGVGGRDGCLADSRLIVEPKQRGAEAKWDVLPRPLSIRLKSDGLPQRLSILTRQP
jgi:hypothetical protein